MLSTWAATTLGRRLIGAALALVALGGILGSAALIVSYSAPVDEIEAHGQRLTATVTEVRPWYLNLAGATVAVRTDRGDATIQYARLDGPPQSYHVGERIVVKALDSGPVMMPDGNLSTPSWFFPVVLILLIGGALLVQYSIGVYRGFEQVIPASRPRGQHAGPSRHFEVPNSVVLTVLAQPLVRWVVSCAAGLALVSLAERALGTPLPQVLGILIGSALTCYWMWAAPD